MLTHIPIATASATWATSSAAIIRVLAIIFGSPYPSIE
jgi:hypothetical protein